MVGGTTPSRVIQVRFPESCPQPSLAKQAVLAHRPGYFCLDNAFALIEGHPRILHPSIATPSSCHWFPHTLHVHLYFGDAPFAVFTSSSNTMSFDRQLGQRTATSFSHSHFSHSGTSFGS